jgi:hypothetical protein
LLRVNPATEQLLEQLAEKGLYGRNKAEVATFILREWTWNNTGKLKEHGINFDHLAKGNGKRVAEVFRQKGT